MGNYNAFSIILLIVVFLYVISPIDLVPGPVDDVVLMLLCLRANRTGFKLHD